MENKEKYTKEDLQQAMDFIDKYKHHYGWREDTIQDAFEKWLKYYDNTKGTTPPTYIKMMIDSVIKTAMRTQYLKKNFGTTVHMDKTFEDDNERTKIELDIVKHYHTQDNPMEQQEEEDILKHLISTQMECLNKSQRMVIELSYLKEMSITQVAAEMNKSYKAITMLKSSALKKMRENNL